jgi:hypothetical protein
LCWVSALRHCTPSTTPRTTRGTASTSPATDSSR